MERHENPYEILGVPFDADEETVKKAFRKAAKKYHPDRQQSEEDREKAHDVFAKYSAAYEILTDPVKRYDWKQAYASRTSKSTTGTTSNPVPSTPSSSTGKKPAYCPQSAPARTSTAYTYKPPSSEKPSSSAPPPPPPFTQEKRNTPTDSPRKKSSATSSSKSTSQSSWQPPPPKKQAPPPPPFHEEEQPDKSSKKRSGARKSTAASTASVSSSSYSYTNRGKETVERRAKEEPSGSYSLVPQLVSGSHLKEDLRPRLRSSCIFSEPQQSNAAGKEDLRPRPRSSSIFSELQGSNSNIQNPSFRRTSSHRPSDSPKRSSTAADDTYSQRGRSFSPRRSSSAVPNKNPEPLKSSSRNIRSQSPRQRRESTANPVEPASPRQVPLTSPTKARAFFGLVSKSPKTNNFLKELMRDTRVDAEPYRRKQPAANTNDGKNSKDGEDSVKGGRLSSQAGGSDEKSLKRSKSLSGSPSDTTPASSSLFPSKFRFSISRRASEKQLDTSYSFSTEQEMEAINSPKPLRRGRRPQQ